MDQVQKLQIIQNNELLILKEIKRLCDKHSIRYILAFGSCLGAVRHDGFIPWDDDIDVAMPLDDYKRFLEICKLELNEDFFLQTFETDKNYYYPFAKVRKNNTAFITWNSRNHHIHQGFWVDIFPIVKIPKNPMKLSALKLMILLSSYLQIGDFLKGFENAKDEIGKVRLSIITVLSVLPMSARIKLHNTILRIYLKSPKEHDEIAVLLSALWPTLKGCCFDTIEHKFVDDYYPIPRYYDQYLTLLYGDYLQLPPVEKRVSHSPVIVDENKSYEYYID